MKCRNKVLHDNAANIVTLTRIAAVITICACSVAAGFVALRWFIMRHTIANRITGRLLFLLPFANMLFSGKEQALTAIAVCNACACFAALKAAV